MNQDNAVAEALADDRPIAEPTMFSFRSFKECVDAGAFIEAMRQMWEGQAQWARFTIVSPDHPTPPYPDGYYFEGWAVRPEMMDPPHRQGPFAFPLTTQAQRVDEGGVS